MEELNDVSKKIISDANSEKAKIINEAKNSASEITADAQNKSQKILSEAREKADARYKEVLELENYKAKASLDQSVLKERIRLIEGIIDKSRKAIEDVDGSRYANFLEKSYGALGIDSGTYLIGKEEDKITDEMVKKVSGGKLVKDDKRQADFDKGIKVFSGKAQYSISPQDYLETYKDELEMDIAAFLFDQDKG